MAEFKPAVINCLNCEIWFNRDGSYEVRDHDPANHFTSQVPVAFNPKAKAPEWDRFCQIIFKNADQPLELKRHLEELGGYLIQHSRWLKAWILFHGPKDAGKSTVGRAFSRLLKGATASRPLSAYDSNGNAHAEAGLVGKLMLLDEDFAQGALLPDGFIKKISEEKMLTANPKGKDEFDFVCRSLPVVISNHWPSTRDVSDAFRERAMVFPFSRRIPASQRSDARAEKMLKGADLEGLLLKFIEGFGRLRARGDWEFPGDCTAAWTNWISNSNPVNVFLEDAVAEAEEGEVKCPSLYTHYRTWVRWASPGGRTLGRNRFYEAVDGVLGERRRDRSAGWVWDGYALNMAALDDFDDE
jgi:P4 family phage/plasmid primase-like protien